MICGQEITFAALLHFGKLSNCISWPDEENDSAPYNLCIDSETPLRPDS